MRGIGKCWRPSHDIQYCQGNQLVFKYISLSRFPCTFYYFSLNAAFLVLLYAVLLNSSQILEKIFGDELIMEIIGCLECKFHFDVSSWILWSLSFVAGGYMLDRPCRYLHFRETFLWFHILSHTWTTIAYVSWLFGG